MEDNDYTPVQQPTEPTGLTLPQITLESLGYLNIAAKWTKFLAILGFIGVGIMLLAGLVMGLAFSFVNNMQTVSHFPFPMGLFGLFYVVFAAVYIFPVIYLNNFSNYISKAVALRETYYLTIALNNIKRHFKFIGIATIAGIGCYFIGIIVFIIFMSHNFMNKM